MTLGILIRHTRLDRLLRKMLMVFLVFAAWHVASHDLDTLNDVSGYAECQICRLNHVPIADLPMHSLIEPLVLLTLILVISTLLQPTQSYRYTLGARAPPLFRSTS